jgi:hypothetical protein
LVSIPAVSVTPSQPPSENIKWKILEISMYNFKCASLWVGWWNPASITHNPSRSESFLCPVYPHWICYLPISHHWWSQSLLNQLLWYCSACVQITLIQYRNARVLHLMSPHGNIGSSYIIIGCKRNGTQL